MGSSREGRGGSSGDDGSSNGKGGRRGRSGVEGGLSEVGVSASVRMDVDDDRIPASGLSHNMNSPHNHDNNHNSNNSNNNSSNSNHNNNNNHNNNLELDNLDFDTHDMDQDQDLDLVVQGEWGTKVEALVSDLLRLVGSTRQETGSGLGSGLGSGSRLGHGLGVLSASGLGSGSGLGQGGLGVDHDYGETKAIVFSQWPEMLDIVREALKANHIAHAGTNTPQYACYYTTHPVILAIYIAHTIIL